MNTVLFVIAEMLCEVSTNGVFNIFYVVYDLSFKLKQAFNLSVPLERICVYKSKIFGYSAIDNKIVCMSNGEFKDVVKGEKPKSWIYSQTQVFFKTDGLLLASLECDTIIYRIDRKSVV